MTTTTERYNGWTNYETWNICLWIDNDQGSYNYWREMAQEAYEGSDADQYRTKEENAAIDLADQLKENFNDNMPDLGPSCWADLLSAALSEVNWLEIAEHYIEEVDKEETSEE